MRLLPKSEVNTRKAQERQREVAEGLKLAERVDRLRNVQAEEEASLKKFREATIASIKNETDALAAEKDVLVTEVEGLKKERKDLLKPLDEEWDKVEKAKAAIGADVQQLMTNRSEVEELQAKAKKDRTEAKDTLARAQTQHDLAAKAAGDATRAKEEAVAARDEANETLRQTILHKSNVEVDLETRLAQVSEQERGVRIREEWVDEEKRKLTKEWRLVLDQRATLERAFKRLNK